MKIYLIGNYPLDSTRSMFLYSNVLKKYLENFKYKVILLKPKVILNKFKLKNKLIKKYFSYIDKYVFFGVKIYFKIKNSDIVHISDQANSILYPFIKTDKLSITCHDLINIKLLKNQKVKKISLTGKIYQKLILYFIKKFNKIICVSFKTKKDLIKISKLNKNKIFLIYNSLNNKFEKNNNIKSDKILNIGANLKFFLHIGGNAWYKNKAGVIKIFNQLIKLKKYKNYKLIFAGTKLTNENEMLIKKLKIQKCIINLINPNNSKLCALYSRAEALIFPSHDEGFGWPIIEAQACGCPVFTTHKDPMKEIGKNAVFYFNSTNSIKNAKLINDKLKFKKSVIKSGFTNLKRFEFNEIKKEYVNFFEKQS
jgi:glycosyltransferase involved in cell wall biosynthesis